MNYHLSNWNGNLEKKLNTAPKWGIWREEESNELEYRRSRQARGTKTSICQRLLREFPLFIGSLMAPLNRFCSKIKANRNDLCSSLLLIVINRKFLGFEREKKNLFSHYWHQGSCRSPLNVGLTLFRGRLRCFIDKLLLSKQPLLFPCPLWWRWSGERLPVATSVPPRHRVFPCMNPGAYTLHGWQHKGHAELKLMNLHSKQNGYIVSFVLNSQQVVFSDHLHSSASALGSKRDPRQAL